MQSKLATAGGDVQHLERGTVVLEDPDVASWHFNPPAPALEKLITLIVEAFGRTCGNWDAGRHHLHLFDSFGIEANVRAEVLRASAPGIRTCDCPFSSPLRSRHGCSRWWGGEMERLAQRSTLSSCTSAT